MSDRYTRDDFDFIFDLDFTFDFDLDFDFTYTTLSFRCDFDGYDLLCL